MFLWWLVAHLAESAQALSTVPIDSVGVSHAINPLVLATLIKAGGSFLSNATAPDPYTPQERKSFEGAGAADPKTALAGVLGNLNQMGSSLSQRLAQPIDLGVSVQDAPYFYGGPMPFAMGLTGSDPGGSPLPGIDLGGIGAGPTAMPRGGDPPRTLGNPDHDIETARHFDPSNDAENADPYTIPKIWPSSTWTPDGAGAGGSQPGFAEGDVPMGRDVGMSDSPSLLGGGGVGGVGGGGGDALEIFERAVRASGAPQQEVDEMMMNLHMLKGGA